MHRLWAVTSYFNPAGFRRKLANYRVFRSRLTAPLAAVELSYSGEFELRPGDADLLIQLRQGDVMWQKERLVNIGVGGLPNECDYVAWVDCDIVFDRQDWVSAAIKAVKQKTICQLYRTVHHVARDTPEDRIGAGGSFLQHQSMGFACSTGQLTSARSVLDGDARPYKRGHAWCARRELVAEHELYDRSVMGSGDKHIAFAVTGQADEVIAHDLLAPGHAADYRQWASRFRRAVDRICYLEGDLFHLWHGDLARRQYAARHRILSSFDYDPAVDIAAGPDGCWLWASAKPEMHRMVREYFEQRDEDGVLFTSRA